MKKRNIISFLTGTALLFSMPACTNPLLCTQLVILWIAAKQIIIQSNKFWITWTV